MRRFLGIVWLVGFWAVSVSAQDPAEEPSTDEVEVIEVETVETEVELPPASASGETPEPEPESPPEAPPALRGPSLDGLELPPVAVEAEEFGAADEGEEEADAEDAALLGEAEPPATDPTLAVWSDPRPVFSVNGYFRVRGNLWDNFALGRERSFFTGSADGLPFTAFVPADAGASPTGGCGGPYSADNEPTCSTGSDQTRYADMRLRLQPTISVSDDIRVHMMFDAFDNMLLGSTPEVKSVNANGEITGRAPGADVDSLTRTSPPPQIGRNTVSDALIVRRAWAEVSNRAIGQLRFGRMGHQWGLGMLWNSGEDIDDDFTTEIDRVQAIAKLAGIYLGASWDFPSQGFILDQPGDIQGIPFDGTTKDDARQWSFLLARRMEPLEQARRLRSGKWVVNGGAYFIYRTQSLSSSTAPLAVTSPDDFLTDFFIRRDAKVYMPDAWFQALWKDLRFELEFAYTAGKITSIGTPQDPELVGGASGDGDDPYRIRQWGIAFEGEYRTLQKKLGVYLKTGFASGDPEVSGLSYRENLLTQNNTDANTLSNFSFNPNYRVDLILYRRILGTISGSYYLAPGMSYDILRTDFGNVLGGRFDFIYSRAQYRAQTYGDNPNLGSELDLQVYYRTGDGPSFLDGYYTAFQYGILFPLKGMKFPPNTNEDQMGNVGRAWTLRLIMAVQY